MGIFVILCHVSLNFSCFVSAARTVSKSILELEARTQLVVSISVNAE
uniref:Uncharacterized protein n=1 Tax=Zea mays TaxID=4577 RepID=C4J759_MAIZE|nr:unknown [Zea mays]